MHQPRWKALFICGSLNQTRQMHQIAQALPECDPFYTPYYGDGFVEACRRLGLIDFTILGWPWRKKCMRYLRRHGLRMDHEGRRLGNEYDLVVTCSDVLMPKNISGPNQDRPVVAVQEGITDPQGFWFWARKVLPFVVPRWAAGTAWTGTSNAYSKMCVASDGYRDHFVALGADPDKLVVTGIPNFDDCARYRDNDFPQRDYVLVCTSDTRETLKFDNRRRFIARAVTIAAGRPLIFKLHPNEDPVRSRREILRLAPQAQVFHEGCAEEMVANAQVLICQYSTLAFVGLALGKEVHSYFDVDQLARLLPRQGGGAAAEIAQVCRDLVAETAGARSTTAREKAAAASEHRALPTAEVAS
jgi:hypothetical protein